MKRIIKRTTNNSGDKCKTYVYNVENAIVFHKYTLIKNKEFANMLGGETIIRETENYILTFHWFSIKKQTLFESFIELGYGKN